MALLLEASTLFLTARAGGWSGDDEGAVSPFVGDAGERVDHLLRLLYRRDDPKGSDDVGLGEFAVHAARSGD